MTDQENNAHPTTQQEVLNALHTITRAILGQELKGLNESIRSLDSTLSKKIESIKNEMSNTIETLKKQTGSRLDELSKKVEHEVEHQAKTFTNLENRFGDSVAGLSERIQKSDETLEKQINAAQRKLENELTSYKKNVDDSLSAIGGTLKKHAGELKNREDEGRRFAKILNNFARAFSTGEVDSNSDMVASPYVEEEKKPVIPAVDSVNKPPQPHVSPTQEIPSVTKNETPEEKDEEHLPDSGDIVESIDGMFKLKK